jgi:hypothetical protein
MRRRSKRGPHRAFPVLSLIVHLHFATNGITVFVSRDRLAISKFQGYKLMPIDMGQLDALFATAVQKASAANATLEDINKATEIGKAASEARKAAADATNSNAQIRLEGLKSLATFLVPIVSLLTIAFTVWIQYQQLQETQRQDEATQWRDFLSSAKATPASVQSDLTFAPRLRSFFSSPTYKDQAISISKRMMGQIADSAGFDDLFDVTFGSLNANNLSDVIDVGRLLYLNQAKLYTSCAQFFDGLSNQIKKKIPKIVDAAGICARTISEKSIKDLELNSDQSKTLNQLRHDTAAFEDEVNHLSPKIADFLRGNYSVGSLSTPTTIPLTRLYFFEADLSNVDFSNFDISETVFDHCDMKGAKLTPKKFGDTMDIRGTYWWDAREINQDALAKLIANEYPYYIKGGQYRDSAAIDKNYYVERIRALCVPMRPYCQPNQLQFGSP